MALTKAGVVGLLATAVISFHAAFAHPSWSVCIVIYFGCLIELTRVSKGRTAFYLGLAEGLMVFAPKLGFFYTLFSFGAVALWLILALWHALFLLGGHWARKNFRPWVAVALISVFWTGQEYFRSELYPLKFSWMSGGYAFSQRPGVLFSWLGVYGVSFFLILVAGMVSLMSGRKRIAVSIAALGLAFVLIQAPSAKPAGSNRFLEVAGIQLEFPVELEVPAKLDALKAKYPEAELLVLSEYSFDGPIPRKIHQWCRKNQRYLIVGGKEPLGTTNFYNTAFVIGPDGETVFKQVKAVPIQFFKDGLPAPEQRVWESPWGKIGMVVCYDLSYTRVVDELVRQGAEILIAPTMDVEEWGLKQHELHALIAPTRAAEYGLPVFRLASSGISQVVNGRGEVEATAPFPGPSAMMAGRMQMGGKPGLPLDRFLGPICVVFSGAALLFSFFSKRITSRFGARIDGMESMPAPGRIVLNRRLVAPPKAESTSY